MKSLFLTVSLGVAALFVGQRPSTPANSPSAPPDVLPIAVSDPGALHEDARVQVDEVVACATSTLPRWVKAGWTAKDGPYATQALAAAAMAGVEDDLCLSLVRRPFEWAQCAECPGNGCGGYVLYYGDPPAGAFWMDVEKKEDGTWWVTATVIVEFQVFYTCTPCPI